MELTVKSAFLSSMTDHGGGRLLKVPASACVSAGGIVCPVVLRTPEVEEGMGGFPLFLLERKI
jgi:hypothetical protein